VRLTPLIIDVLRDPFAAILSAGIGGYIAYLIVSIPSRGSGMGIQRVDFPERLRLVEAGLSDPTISAVLSVDLFGEVLMKVFPLLLVTSAILVAYAVSYGREQGFTLLYSIMGLPNRVYTAVYMTTPMLVYVTTIVLATLVAYAFREVYLLTYPSFILTALSLTIAITLLSLTIPLVIIAILRSTFRGLAASIVVSFLIISFTNYDRVLRELIWGGERGSVWDPLVRSSILAGVLLAVIVLTIALLLWRSSLR
jgi:hypothetical protein